jgi:hypothetical protein
MNDGSNLTVKTKLGSTVVCNSAFMPACQVRAISAFPTTPSAMLAALFAGVERHVNLCLQAQGNQYQHLL